MREELRRELVDLGIPMERHSAASLSRVFPPEFKMESLDLTQTDIAEVLIAFVKRGLITLSRSGDAVVRRPSGAHVCHFYRNEDEMVRMTASFLEEGLRGGERCLWVLPAWLSEARARAASHAVRGGLNDGAESGRLFYLTQNEVYLDASGVLRSAPEIIDFWLAHEKKARADGFEGIRITGDGTGLVSNNDWKSGVDYERLADAAFQDRRVTALCTYSLATLSPNRLAEVLSGHDCGLIHRSGAWDEIHPGAGVATAIEFLQSVS